MGDTANQGGDGANGGGDAGNNQQNQDGQNGGAGNDAGKPKRDPLFADLPDDHPLVKAYTRVKDENKDLKPKAKIVDDAEEAKKSDAQKIADLQAKVDAQPAAVAVALREHLVELHGIDTDDADLFLTGTTPEVMLKQVKALLEKSGGVGPKKKNYVKNEGNNNGAPPADQNKAFAKSLFGGSDD